MAFNKSTTITLYFMAIIQLEIACNHAAALILFFSEFCVNRHENCAKTNTWPCSSSKCLGIDRNQRSTCCSGLWTGFCNISFSPAFSLYYVYIFLLSWIPDPCEFPLAFKRVQKITLVIQCSIRHSQKNTEVFSLCLMQFLNIDVCFWLCCSSLRQTQTPAKNNQKFDF